MKWEYITIHQAIILAYKTKGQKSDLDILGSDGWELVCYVPGEYKFIFKRPVKID